MEWVLVASARTAGALLAIVVDFVLLCVVTCRDGHGLLQACFRRVTPWLEVGTLPRPSVAVPVSYNSQLPNLECLGLRHQGASAEHRMSVQLVNRLLRRRHHILQGPSAQGLVHPRLL